MLLNQIIRLTKYFFLWLIYFVVAKALFLTYNFSLTKELSLREITGIFRYGLVMDVSTACYLLGFPALLFVFRFLISAKAMNRMVYIYTAVLTIIVSFLQALDLGLYPHWGTKINFSVMNFIRDPVSLRATVVFEDIVLALLFTLALTALFLWLYKKLLPSGIAPEGRIRWYIPVVHLILGASLIIPIRGGFDTSPLNHSSVAFSTKLYVNQSATNYLWNFFKSLLKRKVLTRVSFDRVLFKKELLKAKRWLKPKESLMLKAWCLATFGHVYRDVIAEVFESIT